MIPMFTGTKPPAPGVAASPSASKTGSPPGTPSPASPRVSKKSQRPPRVYDDAAKCRIEKYEGYRKTCSADEKKQEGSCEMVKKCKQHGVGSTLWPVDLWHLDDEQFKAVNEKFKDPSKPNEMPVRNGKQCMNEVMRADAKFVKEIETCEKKSPPGAPSAIAVRPKSDKAASVKPRAASARPASTKPKAASVKPKPVSVKPKATSVKPKIVSVKPKIVVKPKTNAAKAA